MVRVGGSEAPPADADWASKIHYTGPGTIQLFRDGRTAKAAEKWKPGQKLQIQGTIGEASLGNGTQSPTPYERIQVGTLNLRFRI